MKHHMNSINQNKEVKIELVKHLNDLIAEKIAIKKYDSITIACIGTDRSTGDSLGPIVGDFLEQKNWGNINVVGSLESPLHAKNFEERISLIPKNSLVIAVDACLSQFTDVGFILINNKNICPGKGVGKKLSPIGDISIRGIVNNAEGFMALQNTRLFTTFELAKTITNILSEVIPFVNLSSNMEAEEIIA